jgi:hypothetical protein
MNIKTLLIVVLTTISASAGFFQDAWIKVNSPKPIRPSVDREGYVEHRRVDRYYYRSHQDAIWGFPQSKVPDRLPNAKTVIRTPRREKIKEQGGTESISTGYQGVARASSHSFKREQVTRTSPYQVPPGQIPTRPAPGTSMQSTTTVFP